MVLFKKVGIAILAVYGTLFAMSFIMWPVRDVWYGFIDSQAEIFVGLLVLAIIGVVVGGGGDHHR